MLVFIYVCLVALTGPGFPRFDVLGKSRARHRSTIFPRTSMCLTDCNLFLFKCLRLLLINDNVTEIATRPPCFLPEAFANIFVINIYGIV